MLKSPETMRDGLSIASTAISRTTAQSLEIGRQTTISALRSYNQSISASTGGDNGLFDPAFSGILDGAQAFHVPMNDDPIQSLSLSNNMIVPNCSDNQNIGNDNETDKIEGKGKGRKRRLKRNHSTMAIFDEGIMLDRDVMLLKDQEGLMELNNREKALKFTGNPLIDACFSVANNSWKMILENLSIPKKRITSIEHSPLHPSLPPTTFLYGKEQKFSGKLYSDFEDFTIPQQNDLIDNPPSPSSRSTFPWNCGVADDSPFTPSVLSSAQKSNSYTSQYDQNVLCFYDFIQRQQEEYLVNGNGSIIQFQTLFPKQAFDKRIVSMAFHNILGIIIIFLFLFHFCSCLFI